ncbi:hypothetical protein B0H10DRAFT_2218036 [Mycena sp. CBHHK59/15]|nr:hypothetical protein B0H10DRAFT_2218036 [Mycena sp. CBHHK59/15]
MYEPITGTLVDALWLRFGFLLPPSPDKFIPPQGVFDVNKDLANIVRLTEIGSELASHKGLDKVLAVFFAQCTNAHSYKNIDKSLLSVQHPPSPFSIGRECLRSMLDPSKESLYYVLRRRGGVEIGTDVLLFLKATDVLEVLRQGWGPDLRDVVGHLLARGITFWHTITSAKIMPANSPPAGRPKGYHPDFTLGLGFRPTNHVFDEIDYKAYTTTHDHQLLNTPRGRIALQYGGNSVCLWDEIFYGMESWHERLSGRKIDLICGLYHLGTGLKRSDESDQTMIVSWWPKLNAWAGGGLDAWWAPRCEDTFFQKRLGHIKQNSFKLPTRAKWRHNLKFSNQVKKCWEGCEAVADTLVEFFTITFQSQPLKTPVGGVSVVLRTFASPPADYQYRNFIQNSNPRLNGGFTIITALIRSLVGLIPPPPPPPRSTSARRSSTSPVIVLVVPPPSALDLQPDLGPSSLFATAFDVDRSLHSSLPRSSSCSRSSLILTSRIIPPPFSAGQWLWYYCARVGLRLIFFTTPPTLAQIGMLPPLTRIAAFVEYAGRFAKEGYGAVYVTAVVKDYFLGQFYSGQIGVAEFLEHMRVKVGHAADLPTRRKRYSKCDFCQTHFWLFCFRPHQRKVTEHMCHVYFDMKDKQAYLDCSCHVVHEEYW